MKFLQKSKTKNQQTKQKPCMRLNSHPISYCRTLVWKDFLLFSKGQSWYEHTKKVLLIKYNDSHEARHTSLFNVLLDFWT